MSDVLDTVNLGLRLLTMPGVAKLIELYAAGKITPDELRKRIEALKDPPPPKEA